MNGFFDDLKTKLESNRKVRPNSSSAYFSNLKLLVKILEMEQSEVKDLDFLLDIPKVLNVLEGKKNSTIRNYIASIVVFLSLYEKYDKTTDKYRELMEMYNKQYVDMVKDNKMTESQEKNWTSMEELKKVLSNYKKEIDSKGILKKDTLNRKEMDLLQKYLVGSLYIGDPNNPPLRLDYAPMKIISRKDYSKLTDNEKTKENYLINGRKKEFSIGEYKTNRTYGTRIIEVGSKLNTILNMWLKYNKSNYLLLNTKGEAMSPNGLTKYLIKVFEPTGKKISASLLRHIYLTNKIGPLDEAKKNISDKMLHSTNQQSDYVKIVG